MASCPLPGSPRWAAVKEVQVLRLLVREPAAVVELWLRGTATGQTALRSWLLLETLC